MEEGELSDHNQHTATADLDQALSEEQSYQEIMWFIRLFMGWRCIPNIVTTTSTADDNPFARPKVQPFGKISVNMPSDEWLCKKLDKLNVTLLEGYPSCTSDAGCLLKDQFI